MNDFFELEAELRQLRPVAPTEQLLSRVEHSLAERGTTASAGVLPSKPKARINWFALGLGLAAAASVLLLARPKVERAPQKSPTVATNNASPAPAASAHNLVPDALTRVVYHRSDEGLFFPSNTAVPLRRVRSSSRETLRWRDPGTGASLRVSYPTEEVELIPVTFQ